MKKLVNVAFLALPLFLGCVQQATAQSPSVASAQHVENPASGTADARRLLPLQGALNARSFAGLLGRQGPIPAASFIRTADLSRLTPADRDALAAASATLDIDLRTAEEENGSHDALASDPRFSYTRISLLGTEKLDLADMPPSLGEMYVESLSKNQPEFRQVFKAMAEQKDGAVLFHCTAGKDRTGMVAALLLSLAGVPRHDIVHDYVVSSQYLKPMMESPKITEMVKMHPKMSAMLGTPPAAINAFLDALNKQYGGAQAYLTSIGLDDAEVQRLLMRLGQAG